jgi:hypothetical protein
MSANAAPTGTRHAQAVIASARVGGWPAKAEKKKRSQDGDAGRTRELLHRLEHAGDDPRALGIALSIGDSHKTWSVYGA